MFFFNNYNEILIFFLYEFFLISKLAKSALHFFIVANVDSLSVNRSDCGPCVILFVFLMERSLSILVVRGFYAGNL